MNKVLRKIAERVLLIPKVRYEFRRVQAFYDSQVQSGNLDWFDIGETIGKNDR